MRIISKFVLFKDKRQSNSRIDWWCFERISGNDDEVPVHYQTKADLACVVRVMLDNNMVDTNKI